VCSSDLFKEVQLAFASYSLLCMVASVGDNTR